MEEDPESEWEIQEYLSSNKGETGTMKWILNKGYGIGKKMIITGIAISAAPLILPPIVVFSAMGVAFSVPSGLVFATYACTNKLMRTLLPTPSSPVLLLEYYSDRDERVKEEGVELDDDYRQVEKGYYMGEYEDDCCREVEVSVMNVDGNIDEKGYCYTDEEKGVDVVFKLDDGGDDYGKYVGASITNSEENIVGEGCYNDEDGEEKVQVADYEEEGEGLIMNVKEIVDEKSYYTTENVCEKEIEDVVVPRDNVIKAEEVEQMEDMKRGVEMRLGLDVGLITKSDENIVGKEHIEEEVQPDDYKQEREALIVNVDEKSYNIDDEKAIEDDVLRRKNVVEEEGTEKMEDIKHGVEMRLGLDVGLITNSDDNIDGKGCYDDVNKEEVQADDFKEGGEALLMNVDEIEDEKRNENDDEKEMENVEMRLGLDTGSITNSDYNIDGKGCYDDVNKEEVQADDFKEGGEALLMNVDEIEDEKRNENDDENEMENVEMRLGVDTGSITNFGSGVDEQGYEEDVGEYLQGDDDSLGEENIGEDMFVESRIDENKDNIPEDVKEEVVEESTGLLEESPSNVASEEVKDVKTTQPDVMVKEIESVELIQNGSKDNEHVGEMRHVILAGGNEENNFNSREVEELDLVAREVVGDSEKDARNIESDEKVMRESMGTQEKTICDRISNDGAKNVILETKKEELISSNADVREIRNESASMNSENLEAGGEVKENVADESVDVLALPASRQATLDADNGEVTAKNDTNMPTKEDILDDEKIWEKIGAMRAIVGYEVTSQPTCIEELKALYVFTGVEPPVSFNGDSGLDVVNDKLKFLMSIVGVK